MSEIDQFKKRVEVYKCDFFKARGLSETSYTDIMYSTLLESFTDYVVKQEKERKR